MKNHMKFQSLCTDSSQKDPWCSFTQMITGQLLRALLYQNFSIQTSIYTFPEPIFMLPVQEKECSLMTSTEEGKV